MLLAYGLLTREVGDGARHLEDAVVGAGREVEALHGDTQPLQPLGIGTRQALRQRRRHLSVAVHPRAICEALGLQLARPQHPLADGGTPLPGLRGGELLEGYGSDLHLQVYAIQQRA